MLELLKTTVNIRVLALCLFILIMGLSAGIFFGGIIPDADKIHLAGFMQKTDAQPFPTLLINLIALMLMGLAGFTVYGSPLALLILFSRSFAVGFCDCLLLYSNDSDNIAGFIFSFLLPQLMLCAVYLAAATISVSYAWGQLQKR